MLIWLTLVVILLDMVSKYIVSRLLIVNESVMIIKNFFNITYVRNTGAAFSIFSENTFLVMVISFMIIMGIILYISKNKPSNKIEKISYSLILGGAIGNFIDRIIYGYVRDFIEIDIFGTDNENRALFGECKWTNKKADVDVLDNLIDKSMNFKYEKYYYIFSKSGFTDALKNRAEKTKPFFFILKKGLFALHYFYSF